MANVKHTQELENKIVAAIKDGATQQAAARIAGVTPETLSIWKREHPAFREAVETARAQAQVFAETSLYRIAISGNVKALMFWLRIRRPMDWQEMPREKTPVFRTLEDCIAALEEKIKKPNENGAATETNSQG